MFGNLIDSHICVFQKIDALPDPYACQVFVDGLSGFLFKKYTQPAGTDLQRIRDDVDGQKVVTVVLSDELYCFFNDRGAGGDLVYFFCILPFQESYRSIPALLNQ